MQLFGPRPDLSATQSFWKPDDRTVLKITNDESYRKQARLVEEYEGYLNRPKTCVKVSQSASIGDPYGVNLKAVVELQENVDGVVTEDTARAILAQCRAFSSEVWPDLSLRSLYRSAVKAELSPRPDESDLQTIETQPALEVLPTTLDLETKDLDSSFLGTLPGASFILTETSAGPSLRDLLGEALPDLSFVLSAAVCR